MLSQCCDIATCQNYDHIHAAKVAVQIPLGQGAFHQYHVISPGFCMGFSTTDSMKISVAFSCILHHSFLCDSLSSDNIACSKPSAGKTKSPISGAIDTAERKKSEARVQSGKEQRSPGSTSTDLDTTRPDPCFFSPALLPRHAPFSLCFAKWKPLN